MRPNLQGINCGGRGHSTSVIEATDYRHELLRLRDHGSGLRKGPTVSRGEEEGEGKLQKFSTIYITITAILISQIKIQSSETRWLILTDKMPCRVGFVNCFLILRVPVLLPAALLPMQTRGISPKAVSKIYSSRHCVTYVQDNSILLYQAVPSAP